MQLCSLHITCLQEAHSTTMLFARVWLYEDIDLSPIYHRYRSYS